MSYPSALPTPPLCYTPHTASEGSVADPARSSRRRRRARRRARRTREAEQQAQAEQLQQQAQDEQQQQQGFQAQQQEPQDQQQQSEEMQQDAWVEEEHAPNETLQSDEFRNQSEIEDTSEYALHQDLPDQEDQEAKPEQAQKIALAARQPPQTQQARDSNEVHPSRHSTSDYLDYPMYTMSRPLMETFAARLLGSDIQFDCELEGIDITVHTALHLEIIVRSV